ncbi:MAG: hypothetical protein P1U34_08265 [Coxiellaceae bacterium]|nr:hypothetical protein [Coxiellaceae bacterium]
MLSFFHDVDEPEQDEISRVAATDAFWDAFQQLNINLMKMQYSYFFAEDSLDHFRLDLNDFASSLNTRTATAIFAVEHQQLHDILHQIYHYEPSFFNEENIHLFSADSVEHIRIIQTTATNAHHSGPSL